MVRKGAGDFESGPGSPIPWGAALKNVGFGRSSRFAVLILGVTLAASCLSRGGRLAHQTVDLGSHSLHAVVAGSGPPAVVFDGGMGTRCEEYRELQERIARTATVVAYDRAGYGSSEVGPLPRDSRREVEELRALLSELEIPRPYILVGHSLGGLNAQVYAELYPQDVAGMVLLDPPPLPFILGKEFAQLASMADRMTEEWQGLADGGLRSDDREERANAEFFSMLASEHREMFDRSAEQVSSISSFGSIPLVVVASGIPNPMFGEASEDFQKFWAAESEALAAKSTRGEFVFAATSGHRLHVEAEELVAERILSLVSSLRR